MSKHILHVVNIYFALPYFIGEQFLHFKNKGNKLHVICSPSPYLDIYAKKMQFDYAEIDIIRAIKPIEDLKALFFICRYIKKNKIDIVVGHTPKGAFLSMLSAWLMRVPKRIYFRHGLVYETSKGFMKTLLIYIDRLTALCATKVVCVSPSLYRRSLEDGLNKESKQIILGKGTCGGIDTKKKFNPAKIILFEINNLRNNLGISEKSTVIGYCGRLVQDKGIVDLVNAFDIVRKKYYERKFLLLLVGMFEERDALPDSIKSKIMADKDIIYTGFINDSIENYYALMDIYILPSYREGFGMSVLEASSMQKPVLTTKVTGCIDSIIDDFTGKYVENNSVSIADGISFYLNNSQTAINHGKNGREFVVRYFDQEILWSEIEKLYWK
jgi:glycosyltransferase involved in cell wall biosynthesis